MREPLMEQRLSVVTLGVADLERSRRFYEDGLGWRRGNDHAEVVFFQIGGAVLALYPRHLLAEDTRVANDGQGFDGVTLAHNTRTREEVDAVLAEAAAPGTPPGAATPATSPIPTATPGRSRGTRTGRLRRTAA